MGARVLDVPWCEDFAYARNAGLAEAAGEWVLYVDADERVDAHGGLDDILADPEAVAARVRFRASSQRHALLGVPSLSQPARTSGFAA